MVPLRKHPFLLVILSLMFVSKGIFFTHPNSTMVMKYCQFIIVFGVWNVNYSRVSPRDFKAYNSERFYLKTFILWFRTWLWSSLQKLQHYSYVFTVNYSYFCCDGHITVASMCLVFCAGCGSVSLTQVKAVNETQNGKVFILYKLMIEIKTRILMRHFPVSFLLP